MIDPQTEARIQTLRERIGEIFDESRGCIHAQSSLWCYWPNMEDPPCDGCRETMDALIALLSDPRPRPEEEKPDERTLRGVVGAFQATLPRDLWLQVARYFTDKPFDPGAAVENSTRQAESRADFDADRVFSTHDQIFPARPRPEEEKA